MDREGQEKRFTSNIMEFEVAMNDKKTLTYEESQNLYVEYAKGLYDKMLQDNPNGYNALKMYGEGMDSLFKDKTSVKILDVGSGSGLSGDKLRSLGFVNVDGLEPCQNFVKVLKSKGTYNHIHESDIGGNTPVGVPDDTYDAVCGTGVFGPGHIPCSAIPEMVRVVKPGGYILICMRQEFLHDIPEYKDRLIPLFEKLEAEGKLKKVEWTIYPDHFVGKDGVRMVFQLL